MRFKKHFELDLDLDVACFGENRRFLLIEKRTSEIQEEKKKRLNGLFLQKINMATEKVAKRHREAHANFVFVSSQAKQILEDALNERFDSLRELDDLEEE